MNNNVDLLEMNFHLLYLSHFLCILMNSHNWILQILPFNISKSPKATQLPLDFWTMVHRKAEVKQQSTSLKALHTHAVAEMEW